MGPYSLQRETAAKSIKGFPINLGAVSLGQKPSTDQMVHWMLAFIIPENSKLQSS